jgi:hypothetical protein
MLYGYASSLGDLAGDGGAVFGASGGYLLWEQWKGRNKSAPYFFLVFTLTCFTVLAAIQIFGLSSAAAQASANTSFVSGTYLALVLIAVGAKKTWSTILTVEPESEINFRQKHRLFGWKAGAAMAFTLLAVCGIGVFKGRQTAELNSLLSQAKSLGVKSGPTKQKLVAILSRDTGTFPEYFQRCTELEATLDEYEPALHQMDSLLSQLQPRLRKDSSNMATILALRNILQKDLQGAQAYRKEIALAEQLAKLPDSGRQRFYQQNITPVIDEETKIRNEEREIIQNAKYQGATLPQSLYDQVGIK